MTKKDYSEASNQAWPSFVDILSSTIVVLCFALLIVVIVLSVSTVSSSTGSESDEASPSEIYAQTDILGEFRAEFQKVLIIATPSLRRRMEVETKDPSYDDLDAKIFSPFASEIDSTKAVQEPGESTKQVLGDIPKEIDSQSSEVLKELLVVQRDVIEQQRKVLEQQNEQIQETTREYQSLLSLVTVENEVEDIRQKITPKEDVALFIDTDNASERLSGPQDNPEGSSRYALNDSFQYSTPIVLEEREDVTEILFKDNSSFLVEDSYRILKDNITKKVDNLSSKAEITLEGKMSDYALSEAEAQRVAVDRLLTIRSLLVELGVPAAKIKLKTLSRDQNNRQEKSYGSVAIK